MRKTAGAGTGPSAPIDAPLLAAVETRAAAGALRLCVPGHGGGAYAPAALRRALRRYGLFGLDWTEVPGLDDLAWPEGPIRDAEARLAERFGAAGAAILVGGSTAGLVASLIALSGTDRPIALGPGQHRSIYAGLALSGATPAFLPEAADPATGYPLGLAETAPAEIARVRPAVVVVAYPTYQGVAAPIGPVAAAAHAAGALVLADAAHGAHFGLDARLPPSPLAAGADIAVLGLHKSLGSLTQTAALVWRDSAPGDRLRAFLRLVQTSSPSYPLMASVDSARAALEADGERLWARALDRVERLRRSLGADAWRPPGRPFDPAKLVWLAGDRRGGDLLAALREHGVEAEYADDRGVLMCLGPQVRARDVPRLVAALADARGACPPAGARAALAAPAPPGPLAVPMLDALRAPGRLVPLDAAQGAVAADFLVPYPPGVPLALPGQRLGADALAWLRACLDAGREVHGVLPGGIIRTVEDVGRGRGAP